MKFISYCRLSKKTAKGFEAYGLEVQQNTIARYLATVPNAELVGSYSELESAAGGVDRPKLKEAIEACRKAKARLVVSRLDRLSRSQSLIAQLIDSKLDFVIAETPLIDQFTISILACVGQKEREMIGERTRQGLAIAKSRGKVLGNPRLAEARQIALRSNQTAKRERIEAAMKPIREIQSAGVQSYNQIAVCLNRRGIKAARSGWSASTVRRVILASAGN